MINEPPIRKPIVKKQGAYWEWYEEWTESTIDGPAECMDAGWRCSQCGFQLNKISSIFDDFDRPPKLKYCPECGKPMTQEDEAE